MKRFSPKLIVILSVALGVVPIASAQINPTPFFTSFADTLVASTFDGQPLAVGSLIQAYDPSGVYCGVDTVRLDSASGDPIFGYFSVYGDDPATTGLDEGAEDGEQITFKINGRTASVTDGDDTWTNQTLKSVTLSAASTLIAVTPISLPNDTLVMPGDTATFRVDVRNDGDNLDFYGVKLEMSQPGGTGNFNWEAFEPEDVVYADSGEVVALYFMVRAPTFSADTVNTVSYTVFSHLDTTATVAGTVDLAMSLTDVEGQPDGLLPGSFVLHQNYPNPFNPITMILFELPNRSRVRVEIVDVLGRIVDTRDLGPLSAGPGQIEYDASNLASGIYLYRVSTETGSQTRKMVLLK